MAADAHARTRARAQRALRGKQAWELGDLFLGIATVSQHLRVIHCRPPLRRARDGRRRSRRSSSHDHFGSRSSHQGATAACESRESRPCFFWFVFTPYLPLRVPCVGARCDFRACKPKEVKETCTQRGAAPCRARAAAHACDSKGRAIGTTKPPGTRKTKAGSLRRRLGTGRAARRRRRGRLRRLRRLVRERVVARGRRAGEGEDRSLARLAEPHGLARRCARLALALLRHRHEHRAGTLRNARAAHRCGSAR